MLGVAAKLEHRRIKERTALGRAEAKAKGVKFGSKPKLTPHQSARRASEWRPASRRNAASPANAAAMARNAGTSGAGALQLRRCGGRT
jgi:DNA invertase Pin-like site-specific DNA recombinase